MRFSENGPDIPSKLIDAALRGEVVFLCGAGVSSPSGLPNFEDLTKRVFAHLGLAMDAAEQHSFGTKRYEETLGSLSRRLADRRSLYDALSIELDADKAAGTQAHATLLRLSRDFEGRPALVTTNFDTLLERALNELTKEQVRDKSFASAQVPAPAGPRFEGIIHLHGRLADTKLGLDESDLVLTSADYGDAYLRSGWAARFLYDLARTRMIVLVGYSASDAPVRYILNILEADRERFPDLKTIYVLDQAKPDTPSPSAAWDAIAVEPILFTVSFQQFWADMGAWADLVELPRRWRKERLAELAGMQIDQVQPWERDQAIWMLSQQDGMDLLEHLPFSPQWIEFVRSHNLVKPNSGSDWALCRWAIAHFDSPLAFQEVLKSAGAIGEHAAALLLRGLDDKNRKPIPPHLERAWRLLAISLRQTRPQDRWMHYAAFGRVKTDTASGDDLREILQLFTPRLLISMPYSSHDVSEGEPTLSALCRREFKTQRHPRLEEFLNVLPPTSAAIWPLIQIASGALIETLLLARDAERTGARYDLVGYDVPSVADHPQNAHHDGFLPLVRLSAELWVRLLAIEPAKAQVVAETWRLSDFPVVRRLWLFALHQDATVSASEVISALVAMPLEDFWDHRKEIMELLRDRTKDGQRIDELVSRIVAGPLLDNEPDDEVQQRIRDNAVWIYLQPLVLGGGPLPTAVQTALDDINARKKWIDRPFEESNFFKAWLGDVRSGPFGDAAPLAQAPIEKRVEIAAELEQQHTFDQSDVWQVYCHDDPEGALDALVASAAVTGQIDRWRSLLYAIVGLGSATEQAKTRGAALCIRVFNIVPQHPTHELKDLSHALVDLYGYAVEVGAPVVEGTWDFLWECSRAADHQLTEITSREDPGYALISQSINSSPGKLARLMVNRLGPSLQLMQPADQASTAERLAMMTLDPSAMGQLARAILVEFVAWVHHSLPHLVDDLKQRMSGSDAEGSALRSILVGASPSVGAPLMARLKEPLLLGVVEHKGESATASNAAMRLVAYVFHDLDRPADDPARLTPGEPKSLLSKARAEIRAEAAETMANWLSRETEHPRDELWRTKYSKVFEQLWPPEKLAQSNRAAVPLARLAIAAGDAFPEALGEVRPYIVALDEDWPTLYFMTSEDAKAVVDRFAPQALELLWLMLKPASRGQCSELGETLDRIKAAEPSLERDRRFQLLQTRALRL
ncbi:SIR2 family protein [Hyphomicrobium sulfonivorans]|uniref:SIR2 family protein n=1 Tax=Hyphomicrobium sulfonivorans TaxID=121290 RepID=UPI0015709023|nr:SIR2 family protein [Hyphomicrobium sulfonivorans]MBI1651383.1 SIR2 family protein [Hyphomicrobium sulfonivorans]NSL73228.1 hypothetical protein [Hyphomicrobium sulfonivorans]